MQFNQKVKIAKNFFNPNPSLPSASSGDSYIASSSFNGWVNNYLYTYNGSTWDEERPFLGCTINLSDTNLYYRFNTSSWELLGSNLSSNNVWTGTNTFNNTVTIGSLNGVVKASSGVISAGSIDISGETNLAVSSPITLTGDTVGFSFSTDNTWSGTNAFNNTVTIGSLGGILKGSTGVVSGSAGIDDLSDVVITSVLNNQELKYNGSNWVNYTKSVTLSVFKPTDGEPPSSNFATLNIRNIHPILEFDAGTDESIIFSGVLPQEYKGGDINVVIIWSATSATSGTVRWSAELEDMIAGTGFDLDANDFETAVTGGSSASSNSGSLTYATLVMGSSNRGTLTAGSPFRLRITRDADGTSGTDDMTGDAELVLIHMYE